MIRPCHDLSIIRPRPDIHAAIRGIQLDSRGHVVDSLGNPRTGNPIQYKVTARRDQFAFGEVVSLGNGTPYGSGRERPEVTEGTIVGFDLGQVGHVLPDGNYTLMWKNMLCTVGRALAEPPRPLCSWVMTEPDDIAMSRFVFSHSSLITIPSAATSGIKTSDERKTNVRLRVERVVDAGPGEFVRKVFYDVGCKNRDIACFTAGGTVHVHWTEGRRLAFTPWSEIVLVIDGS